MKGKISFLKWSVTWDISLTTGEAPCLGLVVLHKIDLMLFYEHFIFIWYFVFYFHVLIFILLFFLKEWKEDINFGVSWKSSRVKKIIKIYSMKIYYIIFFYFWDYKHISFFLFPFKCSQIHFLTVSINGLFFQ